MLTSEEFLTKLKDALSKLGGEEPVPPPAAPVAEKSETVEKVEKVETQVMEIFRSVQQQGETLQLILSALMKDEQETPRRARTTNVAQPANQPEETTTLAKSAARVLSRLPKPMVVASEPAGGA